MSRPKIIGHRGYRDKYPENTMISFQKAIEAGAETIEMDIHYTTDRELIVHHDYYLGVTDNGTGIIFKKRLDYLQSLDAGSWFDKKYCGEHIPTLEEVFTTFGRSVQYELELKGFSEEFLYTVLNLINEHNMLANIEFTSPHIFLLHELRKKNPEVQIGMFIEKFPGWMSNDVGSILLNANMTMSHFNVAHCPLEIISPGFISLLHRNMLRVHAADCNTKESILKAIELQVDQFSTDKVKEAVLARREYEKHT